MDSNKPSLDHLRENWKAQLEDIAVYFPDEYAMTNALHDIDAQIVLCLAFKAEMVIKTVHGDMEARPGTLAELGHENSLNMLQWLNNAWRFDVQEGKQENIGVRHFVAADIPTLIELSKRGYVSMANRDCWVRPAGMDYIKALKHDLRK